MSKGTILCPIKTNKIYRIISKERFFELFSKSQNTLARPIRWDDPFENLALKSVVDIKGKKADFAFKNDLYGQCWTKHKASDAMWRRYSECIDRKYSKGIKHKRTDGIRIRTTVGKLLDSLSSAVPEPTSLSCFIGEVRYLTDSQLKEFARKQFSDGLGSNGKKIAETLLIKRNAFLHEREVRLIYWSQKRTRPEDDFFPYTIDPHNLIDQIMLHPQLAREEADLLKEDIKKKTEYKGDIKRSLLYAPPAGFEFKLGGV